MPKMQGRSPRVTLLLGALAIAVTAGFLGFVGKRWLEFQFTVDLSGHWEVTLPAGFENVMTIEALGDNTYRVQPLVFAGDYELRQNRLVMVRPVDSRLTEFVWELQADGSLVLVEEPPAGETGAIYRGTRLRRTGH